MVDRCNSGFSFEDKASVQGGAVVRMQLMLLLHALFFLYYILYLYHLMMLADNGFCMCLYIGVAVHSSLVRGALQYAVVCSVVVGQ